VTPTHPPGRNARAGEPIQLSFDTAQAYGFGQSERLLGLALAAELRSAKEQVVIATKGACGWTATNWSATPVRHVGAPDLSLSQADLAEIDRIMAAAVPFGGPSPEGMS
jgi:hypothetical protein